MAIFFNDSRLPTSRFLLSFLPWRATGQVTFPTGLCTGTLVGSCHVLTASHCIPWDQVDSKGWWKGGTATFQPGLQNAPVPAPPSWWPPAPPATTVQVLKVLRAAEISNPIPGWEAAWDWAVLIIDTDLSESHGFCGVKSFQSSWANSPGKRKAWFNIGYNPTSPAGLTGVQMSSGPWKLDSAWPWIKVTIDNWKFWSWDIDLRQSYDILAHIDTLNGHSGGPLWGFFGDKAYVVAVDSMHDTTSDFMQSYVGHNHFGGGKPMVELVDYARKHYSINDAGVLYQWNV